MSVDVFFDYTCGFSNRARHWLDALEDVDLVWRPFSLLEQNARDSGTPVFEQDQYADNPSLIALAVHEQVRAQGGDLDAYRRRMFTAWHEEPGGSAPMTSSGSAGMPGCETSTGRRVFRPLPPSTQRR